MTEHSPTDRCVKALGHCPFCEKEHATYHGSEFYACVDCGKTYTDTLYTPAERELKWWAFLRDEYVAGRINED